MCVLSQSMRMGERECVAEIPPVTAQSGMPCGALCSVGATRQESPIFRVSHDDQLVSRIMQTSVSTLALFGVERYIGSNRPRFASRWAGER